MNYFKRILFLMVLLALSASCQIDYDLAGGENDESRPDILMEGVVQIQKDDRSRIILKARKAAFFSARGESVFEDMEFLDYGEGDRLLRKGTAQRARLSDNNDALFSGGVLLESYDDEIRIEGSQLSWKDESRQLSSPPEEIVRMTQKGEKEIGGMNFLADFTLNEISFKNRVEGMVVIDE